MKKFTLIIILIFSLGNALQVSAQNGSNLTVDSVILTTNPADVKNLVKVGYIEAFTKPVFFGSKKKLTKDAELSLKQQALSQGVTTVLVTFNEFLVNTQPTGGNRVHLAGDLYSGKISSKSLSPSLVNSANAGILYGETNVNSKLTVDSVILTTNPADVINLVQLGQIEATSTMVVFNSRAKLKQMAELSLKQQAFSQGANIVFVKSIDFPYGYNEAHMVGVLYSNNKAAKKDNTTQSPADKINLNDLSGKWEGYQVDGQLVMDYEICLAKVGENLYSGVDYCRWVRNSNNAPLQYKGSELPNARKAFLGSFKDGLINISEINNISNNDWRLQNEKFKLVKDKGILVLVNFDGNGSGRKFYLKRTGDYPQDYLKYVISKTSLKIDTVNYHNPNPAASIRYDEKGTLEFLINNKTANNFHGLTVDFSSFSDEKNRTGFDLTDGVVPPIDLDGNSHKALDIRIASNLALPAGFLKIRLTLSVNQTPLTIKYFDVPTNSFLKTSKLTVPLYTSARMRAVAGYYGFLNGPYTNVPAMLEPLVASGDKMAAMWKGVFLSMGLGEYKTDEAEGIRIVKSSLKSVEARARTGDAEAMYLMFYACQMGLEGDVGKSFAMDFLEKAAVAGFKPAVYDYGNQFIWKKDYTSAYTYLTKSYSMGVAKAAEVIGLIYERGFSVSSDIDSAIIWYKKGMAFGDPKAILRYAGLVAKGINNMPPDINKAIGLATSAAAKNYSDAMVFNGMIYYEGKNGVAKSIPLASKWFKAGAELGDRQAMMLLGETYIAGKDENTGLFWIKKAAELGSPTAMVVLANYYNSGTIVEKNIIVGRYWYNQAVLNGYAQADATGLNAGTQNFLNFWNYADFSPSYIYVNEYGEKVADGDDGLMNGFVSGMFGSMFSYYGNKQNLIDGLEYICKKDGFKIYGGTVSSYFISNLYLKQGQTVKIKSYGIISTGMFSGAANADGLGNAWAEYRIVPTIPCSAVMAGIKGSSWQFIGQNRTYKAPKDGPLVLALNAIDYRNYKGYFDLVIEVPADQ